MIKRAAVRISGKRKRLRSLVFLLLAAGISFATSPACAEPNPSDLILEIYPNADDAEAALPTWYLRIVFGPYFQGRYVDSSAPGHAAVRADGKRLSDEEFAQLWGKSVAVGRAAFSRIFGAAAGAGARLAQRPRSLPVLNPVATTVLVVGAAWCSNCKPVAGNVARFIASLPASEPITELIYIETTGRKDDPVISALTSAGAITSDRFYPSVAVARGSRLMSADEARRTLESLAPFRELPELATKLLGPSPLARLSL